MFSFPQYYTFVTQGVVVWLYYRCCTSMLLKIPFKFPLKEKRSFSEQLNNNNYTWVVLGLEDWVGSKRNRIKIVQLHPPLAWGSQMVRRKSTLLAGFLSNIPTEWYLHSPLLPAFLLSFSPFHIYSNHPKKYVFIYPIYLRSSVTLISKFRFEADHLLVSRRLWYEYIRDTVSTSYQGAAAPTARLHAHNFLSILLRAASERFQDWFVRLESIVVCRHKGALFGHASSC